MTQRYRDFRDIGRSTFSRHQRGLDILGVAAIVMLAGVSITGLWQFFAHRPDPRWYGYVPDSSFGVPEAPSTGMAQTHDLFATGSGVVALFGTIWFAYQIAHRVPAPMMVAIGITFFAALIGGGIRYNLIKVNGLSLDEIGPGYTQLFTSDVDYVVTDKGQIGPGTFRLLVLAHIATVPILLALGWWSIRRAIDRRLLELRNAPERTWIRDLNS